MKSVTRIKDRLVQLSMGIVGYTQKGLSIIGITGLLIAATTLSMHAQQYNQSNTEESISLTGKMYGQEESPTSKILQQIIQLDLRNVSVEEAVNAIAQKADLKLMYSETQLPNERQITIQAQAITLYDALWQVLDGTGLRFALSQNGQLILLKMQKDIFEEVVQETVSGTVTDAGTGQTMPGVNVVVKGTTIGTSTDSEGQYELEVPSLQDTLMFSFIGYQTREVPINGRTQIDVTLQAQALTGEDVIVVGYGTQRRQDITGSVSIADPEELAKVSTQSVANALQGQVAGVRVQTSGAPGEEPAINIRGIGSFGANDPLWVVDGVQVDNIIDFDPSQFESVQVLKDAAASAIYGSRAANGVVIIQTKEGNAEDLEVDYKSTFGSENLHQRINMLEREQFQQLNNESRRNVGEPIMPGHDPNSPLFIDDVNTDWQDAAFDRGFFTKHSMIVSGGNQSDTYSLGGSYENNQGTFNGDAPKFEAVTARLKTRHERGRVTVGSNINLAHTINTPQTSILNNGLSLINETLQNAPTSKVRDPNRLGGFFGPSADVTNSIALNTIGVNHLMDREQDVNRALVNLWGELNLLENENLTYKLNLSWDSRDFKEEWFTPTFDLGFFFVEQNGELQITQTNQVETTIEQTLNYTQDIGAHSFDILGGYTEEQLRFEQEFGAATGFSRPFKKVINGGESNRSSGFASKSTLRSFFTRFRYDFDDRYLATVSYRRDGSSRFGDKNEWGNFPSFSLGWRLSEETFIQNLEIGWLNSLKLRGSWGKLGNQEIADFATIPVINNFANFNFNDQVVTGRTQVSLVNEDLKWEVLTTKVIGLDASVLNNAFNFTFEYFDNKSEDILVGVPLPGSIGSAADPIANAATINNSGFEFQMDYTKTFGELNFNFSGNAATLDNEVESLGTAGGEPIFGAASITDVGTEVGAIFGWVTDGIFQSQQEIDNHAFQEPGTSVGDIRFKDLNGDGVVNEGDRKIIGNPTPDVTYGFRLGFNYRNFDASFFFQGNHGNEIFNGQRRVIENMGDFNNQSQRVFNNRWTPENPHNNAKFPRSAWGDPNENNRDSNRWVESGSYLRLQTLTVGYTIPTSGRFGIENLRVFAQGENLFTITGYSGLDPELGTGGGTTESSASVTNVTNDGLFSRGFDDGAWPNVRRVSGGVEIQF